MKLKENLKNTSSDFWYDLTLGGYLKPNDMIEDPKIAKDVTDAIKLLMKFEAACDEQIKDFEQ